MVLYCPAYFVVALLASCMGNPAGLMRIDNPAISEVRPNLKSSGIRNWPESDRMQFFVGRGKTLEQAVSPQFSTQSGGGGVGVDPLQASFLNFKRLGPSRGIVVLHWEHLIAFVVTSSLSMTCSSSRVAAWL